MRQFILAVGVLLGTTAVAWAADDQWYLEAHSEFNGLNHEYRIVVYYRIDGINYYWDEYGYTGPVPVGPGYYVWTRPYHQINMNPIFADSVFGVTQVRDTPDGEWEDVTTRDYLPVP